MFIDILAVAIVGIILGSFSTAIIWRVPRNIPWASFSKNAENKRSQCTHCQHALGIQDLVPVFSFLFYRGKCRYCSVSIGWKYCFIELLCAMMCVGMYLSWGWSLHLIILLMLMPFLLALIFIDLEFFILPNRLVLISAMLGFFFLISQAVFNYPYPVGDHLLGGAIFPLVIYVMGKGMSYVLKRPSLGFGDVKFFAVAGIWLGISYLPFFLICSGAIGFLWGMFYLFVYKNRLFPFGPAIIMTLYVALLDLGPKIEFFGKNYFS